ncbi:Pc22g00580 [Penicillium rubens Wisconsin 54-1255]|uniref:Pc22g00580 protein n=1 Tax=Penicillium rubens (strain ATCC 28089 / DSM 1075 / NRRL 1951 / Wisconsin 54-1255) TaxID=500485 RepID=B6HPH1_PENRW|nr:Pc22g00580 [Penicillium rubens Wisconsin 54-1255]
MTESSLSSIQVDLSPNVTIQPPLSRCGHGPGLILIRPLCYATCQQQNKTLDPEPLKKWAEESFIVAQITLDEKSAIDISSLRELLQEAERGLTERLECDTEKVGLIVYGSKKDYAPQFEDSLQGALVQGTALIAAVFFDSWNIPFFHPMEGEKKEGEGKTTHIYSDVPAPSFMIPGHPDFKISTAGVAHTRSVGFVKKHVGGPFFDLEKIWDEHTYYEFEVRSVEKTMATMVSEPYVNHVPTLTGGIGRARLSHFYLNHFIFNNPDDTALELISRTVGTDRIVDEFIFVFTHVKEIDWMIPGIPPTGKHVRVPFTSVVNIRGDRLFHEHIAWDQATVLVQLGLLPEYLPFPYALPDGSVPAHGKRFEYRVPAAGTESAAKLQNEHEVPSNQMFEYKIREVDG